MALPVHEKDHQTVSFDPNTDKMTILDRAERAKTKLMAYFEANQTYPMHRVCFMWSFLSILSGKQGQRYGHLIKGDLA